MRDRSLGLRNKIDLSSNRFGVDVLGLVCERNSYAYGVAVTREEFSMYKASLGEGPLAKAILSSVRAGLEVAADVAASYPSSDDWIPHKAVHKAAGRTIAEKIKALAKELE